MEGQLKIANRNVIELRNTIRDLEKEKSTWLREYDDVQTKMSEMALGYREKLLAYMAELTAIQSKGTLDTHTADEMYREVMTTTAQRETELLSELEESRQICARVNDKNRSLAQQFRRLRHYLEETGVDTSTVTLDDEELVGKPPQLPAAFMTGPALLTRLVPCPFVAVVETMACLPFFMIATS